MSSKSASKARNRKKNGSKSPAPRATTNGDSTDNSNSMPRGVASALDRPDLTARSPHGVSGAPANWRDRLSTGDDEDVRMSLLDEDQRRAAVAGADDSVEELGGQHPKRPLSTKDKRAMALLILLCMYEIPAWPSRAGFLKFFGHPIEDGNKERSLIIPSRGYRSHPGSSCACRDPVIVILALATLSDSLFIGFS
jgi:hypothetical protein